MDDSPQIYVACLASYNAGILHGRWIKADQGYDAVRDEINEMLKESTEPYAEEWEIHDTEFRGHDIDRMDLKEICEYAELMNEENGYLACELLSYFGTGTTVEYVKEFIENNYQGVYSDLGEFACNLHEECGESIPKSLVYYIDWDGMGKDMEINGEILTVRDDNGIHVLWNN